MQKPTIFIGSSTEGIEAARAIGYQLQDAGDTTVWNEGIFGLGQVALESLLQALERFDFAILVLTPDDLIDSRDTTSVVPRDNVIFEVGLFVGKLGRFRTFVLRPKDVSIKLPSDLAGVTYGQFDNARSDQIAAMSAACFEIRNKIRGLGPINRLQMSGVLKRVRMWSWDEIYQRATSLVSNAKSRVRATAFGRSKWQGKMEYLECLARTAAEHKRNRRDFLHKVVYTNLGTSDPNRIQSILKRKEVFEQHDVSDCLLIKEVGYSWGIEFLIVDEDHLHISFQRVGGQSLIIGLEITDAPEIVKPIAQWYDEYIFDTAKLVDFDALT
jgi:hypothetical protein